MNLELCHGFSKKQPNVLMELTTKATIARQSVGKMQLVPYPTLSRW